jgi:hypothetical protein
MRVAATRSVICRFSWAALGSMVSIRSSDGDIDRRGCCHRRRSASVPRGPVLGWSDWDVVLVAGVKPAQLGVAWFDRALRSSIRSSPWSSRARRSAAAPTASRTGNQVLLAALTRAMANASTESVLPAERRRPQQRRRGARLTRSRRGQAKRPGWRPCSDSPPLFALS